MESQQERISFLLHRFADRSATEAERRELTELLSVAEKEDVPETFVTELLDNYTPSPSAGEPAWEDIYDRILTGRDALVEEPKVHMLRRPWFRYAAAAAVLAIAVIGYLLVDSNIKKQDTVAIVQDIQPGSNGAILTLADGTAVLLDSLGNGVVAAQNGAKVVLQDGQLAYDPTGDESANLTYNKVNTPKSRQFSLTLPDGTKVWLNAASSIRYPTAFSGKERRVEVNGEVFMEVAQDAEKPFLVSIPGKADIAVLGTSFNISAYDNDRTLEATLLEGSIKVNGVKLHPGEQALVAGQPPIVSKVDVNKVVAWKNGLFNFEGASLEEVMKQLERWYDIEVTYAAGIPSITFGGEMTRNISLQGLLLVLEKSDVHFKLEGRKLIVLP